MWFYVQTASLFVIAIKAQESHVTASLQSKMQYNLQNFRSLIFQPYVKHGVLHFINGRAFQVEQHQHSVISFSLTLLAENNTECIRLNSYFYLIQETQQQLARHKCKITTFRLFLDD